MSWLGDELFGTKASIMTKEVKDPAKAAVANPLSSYLASEVGKGLPLYQGDVAAPIDPDYTSRYKDYMSLDPNAYFDKYVQGPQTDAFKKDFLPVLDEGYAGGLRGSGRFRGEEDSINKFQEGLAGERATFVDKTRQGQLQAGKDYYGIQDLKVQRQYADWLKSLPEMNPVLQQAMQFLSNGTEDGTTTLSATDPGKKGIFGDLINAGATLWAI